MSLIQFTRNHSDHSTDKGYQFEFFCDRCHNGFMSGFQPSAIGLASSAARTLGSLFGGVLGSVGGSTYEIERAVQGPGHDKAFREAIEEAKPNFRQCPKCTHWVCQATCWNAKRMLCFELRPRCGNRAGIRAGAGASRPDANTRSSSRTSPRAWI